MIKATLRGWVIASSLVLAAHAGGAREPIELESLARSRALSLEVMKRIESGDDRGALELLRSHLPIDKAEFELSRERTMEKRSLLRSRFGKIVGIELIREERVSDVVLRLTYVEKRTYHLLRWQFTFYRPEKEWRLNSFNWDDNLPALFDSKAPAP